MVSEFAEGKQMFKYCHWKLSRAEYLLSRSHFLDLNNSVHLADY